MTRKNKLAYVMALSALNNLFGGSIDPKYVMHDFEIAMCQAIEELWPGSRSVGCFFHFKQCLTRQMIKCGIPQHIAFRDVAWFDLMTVVPKDEIWDKCVPFIEYHILVKHERVLTDTDPGLVRAWGAVFDYVKRFWDNPLLIPLFNYDDMTMDM